MRIKLSLLLAIFVVIVFSSNAYSLPTHLKNASQFNHDETKNQRVTCDCDSSQKQAQLEKISQLVTQMSLTDNRQERIELSKKYQSLLAN